MLRASLSSSAKHCDQQQRCEMSKYGNRCQTVMVNVEGGIAWVTLNRP